MKKHYIFPVLFLTFLFFFHQTAQAQRWIEMMDAGLPFHVIQDSFQQEWEGKPYQKGKGYKQYKRWEWFTEQRIFPSGDYFNPMTAWNESEKFHKANGSSQNNKNAGPWTPLGPVNWTNASGWNPGNGRINVVVQDPGNANTIYVGAASGGLWKSTNGGTSWTNLTDNQTVLGVSGVAVDHTNSNIIYLGTGDGDGYNTYSVGVLKSTDGGTTWSTTGLNWNVLQGRVITKVLMHPTDPNTLFATANIGVFKTTDAGVNWTQVQTGSFHDIEFHPTDPNIVYSCTDEFFRSTNGGNSFSLVTSGLPASSLVNRYRISVSPNQPNWVYVLSGKESDSTFEGIYRSTNSGVSFSVRTNTPNMFGYADDGSDTAGQSWYDMAMAVNPTNADEVFIGGVNIWKSTNGGSSFTINTQWYFPNTFGYVHADIHDLVFFGTRLYSGSDGGIYKSENSGGAWTNLTDGITNMQFYDIAITPQNANLLLGGTQDNGTNRYNGSTTWTHVMGADGMDAIIDPTNQNIMYGTIQNGNLQKSVNGGNNFSQILDPSDFPGEQGAWVTPYALDPANPNTIFVGYKEIYKSTNGGTSWTALGSTGNTNVTNCLEIAPSNSNVIYVTKFNAMYRTTNGGTSWTNITAGLPNLFFTDIAIDPTNADRVWVSTSGYSAGEKVFQSTNGGSTWTNVSSNLPNLPANCITFRPFTGDELFVGMDVGIYTKDSTATNWTACFTGLPNVIVNEIEINTVAQKAFAGSFGRGAWVMDFDVEALPNPTACQVNLPIPDNSCGATNDFFINVATAPGTVLGTDVFLKEVKLIIAHTWDGDLDISLISPNGTIVELSTDNGGSGVNYGDPTDVTCSAVTTFSMSATTAITAGTAPFIGTFLPEGNLADFSNGGSATGLWTLRLCDDEAPDAGTLQFAQLVFAPIINNPSACQMNRTILDNSCTSANDFPVSVNTAPGTQLGTDVYLKEVNLIVSHTWNADLDISLVSPSGVVVELSTDNGGSGDNYGDPSDPTCAAVTKFTMNASTSITAGTSPFIGSFLPEGDLADFNDGSSPIGNWTLRLCDDASTDQGALQFVELVFGSLFPNPTACQINQPIPDLSCGESNRYGINVLAAPGTQMGTDVRLKEVHLVVAHTWTGDLDIHLISPNGTTVELSTDNGGAGQNYGNPGDPSCAAFTRFTMSASTPITSGAAPFIGDFLPEGNLADFEDGSNPAGVWTLQICDDESPDAGELRFAALVFEIMASPNCVPNLVVVSVPIPNGIYKSQGELQSYLSNVANGANVEFRSDSSVLLYNGFEVILGGEFGAVIQPCPPPLPPVTDLQGNR